MPHQSFDATQSCNVRHFLRAPSGDDYFSKFQRYKRASIAPAEAPAIYMISARTAMCAYISHASRHDAVAIIFMRAYARRGMQGHARHFFTGRAIAFLSHVADGLRHFSRLYFLDICKLYRHYLIRHFLPAAAGHLLPPDISSMTAMMMPKAARGCRLSTRAARRRR